MKITITWNTDDANTNKDWALMGIRDELIKSAVDVIKTSLSSKRLKYIEVKHRETTKGKKVIKLACNYSIDRINDLRFDVFYMLQRLAFQKHTAPFIYVDRIIKDYPIRFKMCIPRTKGFMNGYWYKICIE